MKKYPLACRPDEAEAQAELLARLLPLLGVADLGVLERKLSAAEWDLERLRAECERPAPRERLEAAICQASAAGVEQSVSRQMASALQGGPSALAGDSVEALGELITDSMLRRLSAEYDPRTHGCRLVLGPTGVGKSVTGVAVLRRLALEKSRADLTKPARDVWETDRSGVSIAWVRAFDLPNARLTHGLGEGEAGLVAKAIRAEFLVLDDLGWESKRASADDVLTEVIATRYDAGRITYATSGLRVDEFTNRYGSAIVRRLTETGRTKGKIIDCWPKGGSK